MKLRTQATAAGLALIAICCFSTMASAADYDESVQGDLGSDPSSPTPWAIELGANTLSGTAGGSFFAGTSDYDLVSFTVPVGARLDTIIVGNYDNIDEFSMSFLGLQAGSPWLDNLGWDIQGFWLLGWMHLQSFMEGVDVLDEMKQHSDVPEFILPLASGVYTLLIEDVDTTFNYSLTFNASNVPEPGAASLGALGTALAGYWLRGRRRSARRADRRFSKIFRYR